MRELHPLPAVDETLAQLSGQEFLLNLMPTQDSGKYPRIKSPDPKQHLLHLLVDTSSMLYHSVTITSAPELFQKCMNTLLANLKGILCLMDDVLVYSANQREHDERLEAVLQRINQLV